MKKIGRSEMKKVNGGMQHLRTLWRCAIIGQPGATIDLCSTPNPATICGDLVENCVSVGTCGSSFDECIF